MWSRPPAAGSVVVQAALDEQRADRRALLELGHREAVVGPVGVKEAERAGDRRDRVDRVREARGGDDVVDQRGAAGEADQVDAVVDDEAGRLLPVDELGDEEDVVGLSPSCCRGRAGASQLGARQAVREDRDVAAGLGGGDDAVVVLHHLRGVAAAAVQRDHQRVQGAVADASTAGRCRRTGRCRRSGTSPRRSARGGAVIVARVQSVWASPLRGGGARRVTAMAASKILKRIEGLQYG